MTEINFVTFGNSLHYGNALRRIEKEAHNMGVFTNVWAWDETDLDPNFIAQHGSFMQSSRGYGYWIWKPQVVLQALQKTPEGGIVVYADAGCVLHKKGVPRLHDYIAMARQSPMGILGFEQGHREESYSKMDSVIEITRECQAFGYHRVGGIHVWVNQPNAVAFAQEWLDVCTKDNYRFVSDAPSMYPNSANFVEHRHDQSIFSLLSKKYNVKVIPDETWHPNWHMFNYPIHAARMR